MSHPINHWGPGILFGAILIAAALAGCSPGTTAVPIQETEPPNEPSTPLVVDLIMDKAPAVNEEVDLVLEIQAYADAPGTTARIELPPEARLVSGETTWEGDVLVGSPVRLAARIAFTQEGEFTLLGNAFHTVSADMVWGDDDYIYLTVMQDGGAFGSESGANPQLSASPAAGDIQPPDEPSTPLVVDLIMDKAPAVNEEVDLVLEIQAYADAPGTTARIELPPEARLVSGETSWEGDVLVGSPVRLAARIAFTQEGEFTLLGNAFHTVSADMVWGDDDYIYLTVGQNSSSFGFESGSDPQLSASPAP